CKAQNPPRAETCLRCGKKATDHPSLHNGGDGPGLGGALDSDRPNAGLELDFRAPAPKPANIGLGVAMPKSPTGTSGARFAAVNPAAQPAPPPATSASRIAAAQPTSPKHGMSDIQKAVDDFDALDAQVDGPAFDLADLKPIEKPTPKLKGVDLAPKLTQEDLDLNSVQELAKFGAPPSQIWRAPGYAIHVKLRQRELRKMLAAVRATLGEAETKRDDRFVELGTLMRPIAEKSAALAPIVASLRGAEDARIKREQQIASASAAFRDQSASIDREIAALEAPTKAAADEVELKAKSHALAEDARAKAESRTKALEVELKSAQARFESPQTPSTEKAAIYASMASTASDRDARLADEQAATKVVHAADLELTKAKKALTDLQTQAATLAQNRSKTEKDFSKQGAVRAEGVEAASREVRSALLELGRRTYPSNVQAGSSEQVRRAIADAEKTVARLQKDLERHVRAVASADETTVNKGLLVIGGAVLLVIVVLLGIWQATHHNEYLDTVPGAQKP
ncbi:MAG: hypothetical protein ACHREM_33285, partial [Polyangiales bacterium]